MQRVYTDFNTMNVLIGRNDNLTIERRRVWLTQQPFFQSGLRVILFQDEDDFEVEGTIERDEYHGQGGNDGWYAIIDWSTRREL
ncbi:MAG: hypothetical protein JWQ03_3149 [Variovorax sp.]|nr:hypothetical protein [Variovorax sp.]